MSRHGQHESSLHERNAVWYRFDVPSQRLTLTLHIQPNAKRTEVTGLHGEALKIRIAAPAVNGAANTALIAFLKHAFGVPAINIRLKHGAGGRHKIVEIDAPAQPPESLFSPSATSK